MSAGHLRTSGSRPQLLVDQRCHAVVDPDGNYIGVRGFNLLRVIYALPTALGVGGLSLRYTPMAPSSNATQYGCDFAKILPKGVTIQSGSLAIFTNTPGNVLAADADFTVGSIQIDDRTVYATLSGGNPAQDYQLRWTVTDSLGETFTCTGLLLVSNTS